MVEAGRVNDICRVCIRLSQVSDEVQELRRIERPVSASSHECLVSVRESVEELLWVVKTIHWEHLGPGLLLISIEQVDNALSSSGLPLPGGPARAMTMRFAGVV